MLDKLNAQRRLALSMELLRAEKLREETLENLNTSIQEFTSPNLKNQQRIRALGRIILDEPRPVFSQNRIVLNEEAVAEIRWEILTRITESWRQSAVKHNLRRSEEISVLTHAVAMLLVPEYDHNGYLYKTREEIESEQNRIAQILYEFDPKQKEKTKQGKQNFLLDSHPEEQDTAKNPEDFLL